MNISRALRIGSKINQATTGYILFSSAGKLAEDSGLVYDGTNLSIVAPTSDLHAATKKYVDDNATAVAGSDTEIQFNDGGVFGADSAFVWDNVNKRVGIGTSAPDEILTIGDGTEGITSKFKMQGFWNTLLRYGYIYISSNGWFQFEGGNSRGFRFNKELILDFDIKIEDGSQSIKYIANGSSFDIKQYYDGATDTFNWISASNNVNKIADLLSLKKSGEFGIGTTSPDTKLQVVGTTKLGEDTTNFTETESDGTVKFNGTATVWKDINLGAAQLSRPTSSQPDLVTFVDENGDDTLIQTYGFAIGEKIHGSFEMQHDYKEGSDFTPHVHWQGITAPTGTDNVQWRLTYTLMRDDATLDAVTTIDSPDTIFDTQYEGVRTDFAVVTGTNYLIGDQFLFTLERVASTGDAYAGDALIATVGIHVECDTCGSRNIILK